jgi:hypothetical protein
MEYKSAKFTKSGAIDCEKLHPKFGWIPFTASPDDSEKHGRDLFELITAAGGVAAYVAPPEPEPLPYAPSDLSPRRFEYLLAFTGLGDVWDAIQADLKTRDRAQFAQLAAQRSALSFSQVKTLAFVAMFRPVAEQVAPDVDLSDDAIKAAWIMAEGAQI